jgi:hypothetical protein
MVATAIMDSRHQFDYLLILLNNEQHRLSILLRALLNSAYLSLLKQLTIISLKCLVFKVSQELIGLRSPTGANTIAMEGREQWESRKEVVHKDCERIFLIWKVESKS